MKSKGLTLFLSFILPGVGHLYLRQTFIGILLIVLTLILITLNNLVNSAFALVYLVVLIFAMVHSYKTAKYYNERTDKKRL